MILLPAVASHHHPGRAHVLGELGHRPHGAAFHLKAPWERIAVKRPLVPVDLLGWITGADVYQLGQVDLDAAGVIAEHEGHGVDDSGVGNDAARRRRTGDQGASTPRFMAEKITITRVCCRNVWLHLDRYLIHYFWSSQTGDDDASVFLKRFCDGLGLVTVRQGL